MLHEETGEIVRVEDQRAWVKVLATSACGSCAASCGMTEEGYRLVEAVDPIGVEPRQEVGLQLPGRSLVGAALVMYGIPLVLLLVGLLGGHALALRHGWPQDWVGAGAGLTLMLLGFAVLYVSSPLFEQRQTFYPTITRIIASAAERTTSPPRSFPA